VRAFVHLCAAALIAPQLLVVTLFLALGHVTGGHTLGSLFLRTLELADLVLGWGGLAALVATVLVLGAGFNVRSRPFASGAILLLIVGSTIVLVMEGIPARVEDGALFLPAAAAAVLSAALIHADLRDVSGAQRA
jgi:hypothetical protein